MFLFDRLTPTPGRGSVLGGLVHPTYKSVNSFLVASIPEFRPRYDEEIQKRGRHPGPYIAFGILNSMVVEALDFDGDASFLDNAFEIFEKMALSGDLEVVNLLQVGFVQDLVRYPRRLATAWQLMGPQTQKITMATATAWNREMNLPIAARKERAKAKAQGR
jgi:hypothetical protein